MAATIARMPTWRCPHCGTPQTETARCWVCRRSSTACGTCRHFRRSVAAQLGYCGLDRRRAPLVGDEIRACWESTPAAAGAATTAPVTARTPAAADRPGRLDFIEVVRAPARDPAAPTGPSPAAASDGEPGVPTPPAVTHASEPRWNLWGDLET
jgi:hypothetical protein